MHVLGPQGTYLCAVAFYPQVPHLQIQLTTQWKYSKKKEKENVRKYQKQTEICSCDGNYFYSIYIVSSTISNTEMT